MPDTSQKSSQQTNNEHDFAASHAAAYTSSKTLFYPGALAYLLLVETPLQKSICI
jgi:hypothetical protein